MAPITMDPSVLYSAASLYEAARNDADGVMRTLAGALDKDWGCAGSDSAGRTWASSYDPAAFNAVAAGTNIVNAFGKLHDLLAFTAVNHVNTEKLNKTPPETPDPSPAVLETTTAPTFKGAFGGDTDPPFGWELVSSWLQGHTWPNGNPDKLRRLGKAWRDAAKGLRNASDGTGQAWLNLEEIASDELPQALAQMDAVFTSVETVATQYESLASACGDWAQRIEDAHQKILAILAGALGVGIIAGVLVGIFTAGTGAVGTTAAAGSSAGAAIVTVLIAFDAAAALATGVTVAAGAAVIGVATELQPLLDANPTQFNASTHAGGESHNYVPPPKGGLPGFPNAKKIPPQAPRWRKRWKDPDGNTYEWDYQHGAVEKYSKNGKHLGEYDPDTGAQTKPPDPARKPGR
ncbi:colicin E3/pyocin S6 family cytotoxin [Nocardia arthritidis]|uniref:colicin E3/pyocin S6 family cytotoxin n=1 Tax=Nocardia arthritidis TaxID=228602 RepID=UPI000B208E4A|nr:colicin E3/pyocin S6 family cytotoxin [Nocardia arthritidis]